MRKLFLILALSLSLAGCGGTASNVIDDMIETPSEVGNEVDAILDNRDSDIDSSTAPGESSNATNDLSSTSDEFSSGTSDSMDLSEMPSEFSEPYVIINNNIPNFDSIYPESYEFYSDLDELGRCGAAEACIGVDLMPTEERGSISHVKPTGWQSVKYDIVDVKYLYNRCHLIGFQLAGENDNELNLITGTRSFNVDGMLPFENMVADYIKETENHVMYRVTPVYEGSNLVANGVYIEAKSVEDDGEGIEFNVYIPNIQWGITIDYATGESWLTENIQVAPVIVEQDDSLSRIEEPFPTEVYYINTNTGKLHREDCRYVNKETMEVSHNTLEYLDKLGYSRCKVCFK